VTPENGLLAPLTSSDAGSLTAFFELLSDRTRMFYSVTDPKSQAQEHCAAIARYDKLRLVLWSTGLIVALVEFSFDLTPNDSWRFASYGVQLRPGSDCRWGLCVADELQGRGVGTALAALSFEVARRFYQERIILWGGVRAANTTAVRYYRKVGFSEAGRFQNDEGIDCVDMIRELEPRAA
jgi:ribosomal protein S18 acetylase RimI-like enzyme